MTPSAAYTLPDDERLCSLINDTLMMRAYHAAVLDSNGDTLAVFQAPILRPGIVQIPPNQRKN